MSRIIAIRHRQKRTADGQARPTQILIQSESGKKTRYELDNDDDELDFAHRIYPVSWRPLVDGEDISGYADRHIRWRKLKPGEKAEDFDSKYVRGGDKGFIVAERVPVDFDGLRPDDKVLSILGGSGDLFMAKLTREGVKIGADIFGIRPITLSSMREGRDKSEDLKNLIQIFISFPEEFHCLGPRREELVLVAEAFKARQNAQEQRKACGLRLYQRAKTKIYLSDYVGSLRDYYFSLQATDAIFFAQVAEEEARDKDLKKAVERLDLWNEIFKGVKGVGPTIAGGLVACIGDINRFRARPDFSGASTREERRAAKRRAEKKSVDRIVKFLGVHVRQGGQYVDVPPEKSFPRLQEGGIDYNTAGRQVLYQLADQFNRQKPGEFWRDKLDENKRRFRVAHPAPITVKKKDKRGHEYEAIVYSDGHILKMAKWRTLTQFVRWMAKRWLALEEQYISKTAADSEAA